MTGRLYINGTIRTLAAPGTRADWVLARDGHIAAVGTGAPGTEDAERVDLRGRCLIPAFIDPHGHFPESGFNALFKVDLTPPPLGSCTTLAEALDRLARAPGTGWVLTAGFDHTALTEGRFPTLAELDATQPDRPLWLLHCSGHAGAVNSAAMAAMGLAGSYYREGMEAIGQLGATDFQIDEDRFAAGVAAASREYLSQGVALAQNAWIEPRMLDRFVALDRAGGMGIDAVLLLQAEMEPGLSADPPHGLHRLILGPRKLFADGAFQVQTAHLTRPYFKPIDGDPDRRGLRYTAPEKLAAQVLALHRAGHQIHIHANGDAAGDDALDAIEAALDAHPRDDHRHTLIHGQALRDDQLDRMARLGVTVSFFSAHVYFWGEKHRTEFLGPERAARISPARSALDRGVRITLHNDATVTPTRPLHLMWCAVERITAAGNPLGPDQRISAEEALRAHTVDAAWQVFQEAERGSIEPGKRADFAILSGDPVTTDKPLKDLAVEETVVLGQTAWRRP